MKNIYKEMNRMMKEEPIVKMAVVVEGSHQGMQILWNSREYCCTGADVLATQWIPLLEQADSGSCVCLSGERIFVQKYSSQPELVILGGGHISKALVSLGKLLDFRVTVADDRAEFASRERFPGADCVLSGEYPEVFQKLPEYRWAFYVVVTRGHLGDKECVRQILRRPFWYVGMIGSRKKVAGTKEDLRAEGFSDSLLEQIHAPIGLDIKAVTPEEIAVSIAAELIRVKNGEKFQVMDRNVLEVLQSSGEKILAVIVDKKGSAPRGTGTCMVICAYGTMVGTIGGGAIEYEVQKHAWNMLRQKIDVDRKVYQLNNIHSAELGMICGGSNEVMFLRVDSGKN